MTLKIFLCSSRKQNVFWSNTVADAERVTEETEIHNGEIGQKKQGGDEGGQ